jgi:hypothetical protein
MSLNEAIQTIEKETNSPLSLKMIIKLFEDEVITVEKPKVTKFKFGFQ